MEKCQLLNLALYVIMKTSKNFSGEQYIVFMHQFRRNYVLSAMNKVMKYAGST